MQSKAVEKHPNAARYIIHPSISTRYASLCNSPRNVHAHASKHFLSSGCFIVPFHSSPRASPKDHRHHHLRPPHLLRRPCRVFRTAILLRVLSHPQFGCLLKPCWVVFKLLRYPRLDRIIGLRRSEYRPHQLQHI